MPCPHSTRTDARAETCSLCHGAAARRVTRDEATGEMMIDGAPQNRDFQPPMDPRSRSRAYSGRPRGRPKKDAPRQNFDGADAELDEEAN